MSIGGLPGIEYPGRSSMGWRRAFVIKRMMHRQMKREADASSCNPMKTFAYFVQGRTGPIHQAPRERST